MMLSDADTCQTCGHHVDFHISPPTIQVVNGKVPTACRNDDYCPCKAFKSAACLCGHSKYAHYTTATGSFLDSCSVCPCNGYRPVYRQWRDVPISHTTESKEPVLETRPVDW